MEMIKTSLRGEVRRRLKSAAATTATVSGKQGRDTGGLEVQDAAISAAFLKLVRKHGIHEEETEGEEHGVVRDDDATTNSSRRLGIYVSSARLLEVDTRAILETLLSSSSSASIVSPPEKMRCYVPLVADDADRGEMRMLHIADMRSLETKSYGLLEPGELYSSFESAEGVVHEGEKREDALLMNAPLDVLVVPGVAFDRSGNRLGRGGGYYDIFLERARARATQMGWAPPLTIAFAYNEQLVEEVPVNEKDAKVDAILMQKELIRCTERAHAISLIA